MGKHPRGKQVYMGERSQGKAGIYGEKIPGESRDIWEKEG